MKNHATYGAVRPTSMVEGANPMIKKIIPLIVLFTFICSASSAGLTHEQRTNDAVMIADLFEHQYGPMTWKEEFLGFDHGEAVDAFLENVSLAESDEDFFTAILLYLSSFKDGHVSCTFPSTYLTELGFDVDDIDGHVIVTRIFRDLLSKDEFPFVVGDELIAIDGIDVNELRAQLSLISTTGSAKADARWSAWLLTWRPQRMLGTIPTGNSSVTIAPHGGSATQTTTLQWRETGLPLAPIGTTMAKSKAAVVKSPPTPLETLRNYKSGFRNERMGDENASLGKPFFDMWDSFVPIDNAPLFAGTFSLNDKRIGFIRIATFNESVSRMEAVASFLKSEIPKLQNDTDALILDLTDNGGGLVCYGEFIASFFIDHPIAGVMDSVKPTRQWAIEFEEMLDWVDDEKERAIIANIVSEIRASLERGDELTKAFRICSPLENLLPATDLGAASKTYTRPVLILVNEFSASMADAFPAMLQDAGNAKVFGAQTMGLGGGVIEVGPMGNSDITIYMTNSLAWREKDILLPSGETTRFIENVGVIPDYPYDVTMDDFFGKYNGYRAAIDAALTNMLK